MTATRSSSPYLFTIPAEVPAGRVVVHNNVRPTRHLGSRGFRAWLAEPGDRLEVCGCDWAPELGEHYRVRREKFWCKRCGGTRVYLHRQGWVCPGCGYGLGGLHKLTRGEREYLEELRDRREPAEAA